MLSRLYLEEGKTDKAKEKLHTILKKTKNDINAMYALCELEKTQEHYNEAIACYRDIIKTHSQEAFTAHTQIGILQIRIQNLDDALKTAEYLISQQSKRAEGYYIKGLAFFTKKDINEAITNLQLAIKFNPSIIGAYYFIGLSHYLNGNLEQARTELQRVLSARPDLSDVHLIIGLINLRKGW